VFCDAVFRVDIPQANRDGEELLTQQRLIQLHPIFHLSGFEPPLWPPKSSRGATRSPLPLPRLPHKRPHALPNAIPADPRPNTPPHSVSLCITPTTPPLDPSRRQRYHSPYRCVSRWVGQPCETAGDSSRRRPRRLLLCAPGPRHCTRIYVAAELQIRLSFALVP